MVKLIVFNVLLRDRSHYEMGEVYGRTPRQAFEAARQFVEARESEYIEKENREFGFSTPLSVRVKLSSTEKGGRYIVSRVTHGTEKVYDSLFAAFTPEAWEWHPANRRAAQWREYQASKAA